MAQPVIGGGDRREPSEALRASLLAPGSWRVAPPTPRTPPSSRRAGGAVARAARPREPALFASSFYKSRPRLVKRPSSKGLGKNKPSYNGPRWARPPYMVDDLLPLTNARPPLLDPQATFTHRLIPIPRARAAGLPMPRGPGPRREEAPGPAGTGEGRPPPVSRGSRGASAGPRAARSTQRGAATQENA